MSDNWLGPAFGDIDHASPPQRLRIGSVEYVRYEREPQVQVYFVPDLSRQGLIRLRVIVDGRILDLYASEDADLMEVVRQCKPPE